MGKNSVGLEKIIKRTEKNWFKGKDKYLQVLEKIDLKREKYL